MVRGSGRRERNWSWSGLPNIGRLCKKRGKTPVSKTERNPPSEEEDLLP
ncbi:hypothetical protein [Brotaphodocola sp.]